MYCHMSFRRTPDSEFMWSTASVINWRISLSFSGLISYAEIMALFIFNIINIKSEHSVFLQIPHKLSNLVLCLALAAFKSFLFLLVEHLSELCDFLGLLIHLRLYLSQVCDVTQECCLRFFKLASIAFRVILISIVRVELETLDHSVTLGDLLHQQLGKTESLLKG